MTRAKLLWPALLLTCLGCASKNPIPEQTERLSVTVRMPDGSFMPGPADPPLPLPTGPIELEFDVQALRADSTPDTRFQGFVRVTAVPGSVIEIDGDRANGRNVLLLNGAAEKQLVKINGARGPTRLWVEDIGYEPGDVGDPNKPPECADGIDNDHDGLIDYPNDPGCAFANDDTETGGSYAAGVSAPVRYQLPRIADVQGLGAVTPYQLEQVQVMTAQPANLVITRISSDGFYFSDTTETRGYGHGFAFTFNTPPGVRVCDRVTYLAATASEFFGFTELGSPSFTVHPWHFPTATSPGDGPCQVPEPAEIKSASSADDATLEKIESALVRVLDVSVGSEFGPEPATGPFSANSSNCDLDGNGAIDFTTGSLEGNCANACSADPQCVEWTSYVTRSNFRVVFSDDPSKTIQLNTSSIAGFDPRSMRGKKLAAVTGTLRNFSGGSLNWTIETRCSVDLVCDDPSQPACVNGPKAPVSSQIACVTPRTSYDPNEASN